jgi:hypothetical protein
MRTSVLLHTAQSRKSRIRWHGPHQLAPVRSSWIEHFGRPMPGLSSLLILKGRFLTLKPACVACVTRAEQSGCYHAWSMNCLVLLRSNGSCGVLLRRSFSRCI